MKKFSVLLILVCLIFLAGSLSGCVSDSYFQPLDKDAGDADTVSEEDDLMKEIEEIEKALAGETDEMDEVDVEEVEVEVETIDLDVDTSELQRLEVEETDFVDLQLEVSDADEDLVSYSFSKPLDENGQWQTNYGDNGEYVVTITASDGVATSEKKVLLVVLKKNVPPVIEDLDDRLVIDEGEVVSLEPKISDPNKDDVTVTFSEPLDQIGVWETDHTSAGEYNIKVTASDGELDSVFEITLIVNDVNVPPVILLEGIDDTLTVKEGETIELYPEVSDLDGDQVTVTISEPVGDDGVWETGYTAHGEYEITITADDGKDITTKVITLIVEDVNVPPQIVDIKLG